MEPQINEESEIVRPSSENTSLLMEQTNHRSEIIWNGEDPGPFQCSGRSKEMENISMQDNWVIDVIKLVGLEGLFRAPSREINHGLISALVKRWRSETHTFHLPHALLGDKIFMDKTGDRVHLMHLEFLRNLRDSPQYSWGSGCLAWLYRELCQASHKETSQIGGALQLIQY
ncbi:hypothetical protein SO802_026503 [Lithocarpus litseifolius]|uniref:Aminotransferase-like plant mobile domain-containing protein n=1 Tax=Lithocarpus litseifolius TaxID=425828 RepID=A0AAW2C200_9ROSI